MKIKVRDSAAIWLQPESRAGSENHSLHNGFLLNLAHFAYKIILFNHTKSDRNQWKTFISIVFMQFNTSILVYIASYIEV